MSGCFGYESPLARTGGYRFLITDAYSFRESILQTIEHAPTGNDLPTDYCSVTCFYCEPRPTIEFDVPDAKTRRVVDLKKLRFQPGWNLPIHAFCFHDAKLGKRGAKFDGANVRYLLLRTEGPDASGPPFISLTCSLPSAGKYRVTIDAVAGPEAGRRATIPERIAGRTRLTYMLRSKNSQPDSDGCHQCTQGLELSDVQNCRQ